MYPVGDFLADEGDSTVTKVDGNGKATLGAVPVEHGPRHTGDAAGLVQRNKNGRIVVIVLQLRVSSSAQDGILT